MNASEKISSISLFKNKLKKETSKKPTLFDNIDKRTLHSFHFGITMTSRNLLAGAFLE